MELKDFIKEAIINVITGVTESQAFIREKGIECEVCPTIKTKHEDTGLIFSNSGKPIKELEFDVSITISEKEGKKGMLGITMSKIGFGFSKNKEQSQGQNSRLKFSIPITLPSMK